MKKGFLLFMVLAAFCSTAFAQDQTYVGAKGTFPACQACHSSANRPEFTQWSATEHATAYDSASTFVQSTARCLECHTTGWDIETDNLGADEFVTVDTTSGSFNVTITDSVEFAKRTNVGCESCHGPASNHTANPGLSPSTDITSEQCGTCHQDEHHPFIEEWRESGHSGSHEHPVAFLQDRFRNTDCSGCHTVQGFIQFVGTTAADSASIEPHDIEAPGESSLPIGCAACHDPHDKQHPGQLRLPPADLCAKCHNPEDAEPPSTPHHTTASMFAGLGAYEFEGVDYENSRSAAHQLLSPTAEDKCVACHVFMTPFDEGDPNDPSDDKPAITGHTFEPRIESCEQAGCHVSGLSDTGEDEFNHRGRQEFTKGLMEDLRARLEQIEMEILPTASAADSFKYQLALFNLQFMEGEGSYGVHNPSYSQKILETTLAFLDTALVTSVPTADPKAGIPASFELHANYPNPFNPTTFIRFDVPRMSAVRLVVYNSLGQKIETLVDEVMSPNSYVIQFSGNQLASGIYFYKLITEDKIVTRKMLLLK